MMDDRNMHTFRLYSSTALSPSLLLNQSLTDFVKLLARIAVKSDYEEKIKQN